MLEASQRAEKILKRAPTVFEIFVEAKHHNPQLPINSLFESAAVLMSLYREDWLYMNDEGTSWSVNKREGFQTYSERFREKFGTQYGCSKDGSVHATTARTVNFDSLIQVLKSKD